MTSYHYSSLNTFSRFIKLPFFGLTQIIAKLAFRKETRCTSNDKFVIIEINFRQSALSSQQKRLRREVRRRRRRDPQHPSNADQRIKLFPA
jgi:hypothetical protein